MKAPIPHMTPGALALEFSTAQKVKYTHVVFRPLGRSPITWTAVCNRKAGTDVFFYRLCHRLESATNDELARVISEYAHAGNLVHLEISSSKVFDIPG